VNEKKGKLSRAGINGRNSRKSKSERLPKDFEYLRGVPSAVRPQLTSAIDLHQFRRRVGTLSVKDRLRIIEQAQLLLESNYVHLPLKKAMHAIDPIQKLKLLQLRYLNENFKHLCDEIQFHSEMLEIFTSFRDFHTRYFLPSPFNQWAAILPFLIEEYFVEKKGRRFSHHMEQGFMVSHLLVSSQPHLKKFFPPDFKPGVEVLYWNGVPIKRVIEINGEKQCGSNRDARFAVGLDSLTIRPMMSSLLPDEEWVTITYLNDKGQPREFKHRWIVVPTMRIRKDFKLISSPQKLATKIGLNKEKSVINQLKKVVFAPSVVEDEKKIKDNPSAYLAASEKKHPLEIKPNLPGIFRARSVETPDGTFAYIRIFSFETKNVDAFVDEFERLLDKLPQNGLIIDVRSNGGGNVNAGEQLLQLLTPKRIKPEPFEFINTPLNLKICGIGSDEEDFKPWHSSIRQSVLTGATYSLGFPLTTEEACNNRGQKYYGPVVLITDALCYSTTDIFAAGFKDHQIGVILGTSGRTGAGGANVWSHQDLSNIMSGAGNDTPFKPLPKGVNMTVAIRRSLRLMGTPLEEFGVPPDRKHFMTKADLQEKNKDLIAHAAKILARKPVRHLSAELMSNADGTQTLLVKTKNISRLDFYLNGRIQDSENVRDDETEFDLPAHLPANSVLQLQGYHKGKLVAARNIPASSSVEEDSGE
jgi:hypothetical protein